MTHALRLRLVYFMHRLLFVALTTGLLYPIAALSGYLGNADMPSIEEAFSNSDQLIPKLNQSLSNVFILGCN